MLLPQLRSMCIQTDPAMLNGAPLSAVVSKNGCYVNVLWLLFWTLILFWHACGISGICGSLLRFSWD